MTHQVFLPAVARFKDDVQTSLALQEPLVQANYQPGLMLVIQKGWDGVTSPDVVAKQHDTLREFAPAYGNAPIVTMLSNMPIEEIDSLHNTEYATEHVKRGIDFARELPIGGRRMVTFHLNSLVSESEFESKNKTGWVRDFDRIIRPSLKDVVRYAYQNDVSVLVETVPVPEFGDIRQDDEREYRGIRLHHLRNPFYLTEDGISAMKEPGFGVCLDVCHNRTIYATNNANDPAEVLFFEDFMDYDDEFGILNDINGLDSTDLVHLNDGDGLYTSEGGVFREGVALGEGDIKEMPEIIRVLHEKRVPFVLEINETDFKKRPNTRTSIDYLLKQPHPA